jgi:hypothetical protein
MSLSRDEQRQAARRTRIEMQDQAARAARIQRLFREINERLRDLNAASLAGSGEWICECANDACAERITMSVAEYETIRDSGPRFFVAAGDVHVWPNVERIAERNDRYWIVEKTGPGAKLTTKSNGGPTHVGLPARSATSLQPVDGT